MGKADLAEKSLLQYKDVFTDVVNVNLFGGKPFVKEGDLSPEPGELITKSEEDGTLQQLYMDVPMCCRKEDNVFFFCIENQSDISRTMPVRDMGYQHAKYREQIRKKKEENREAGMYPLSFTEELPEGQRLYPVITVVLNYSQKKWEEPLDVKDMLVVPEEYRNEIAPWLSEHRVHVINLADQTEETIQKYHSDFRFLVRYLACHNDRRKLDEFFRTTEFRLDHPEAFLDWLSAVTSDTRYRKAKELIEKEEEGKGGRVNMCVLLDMYEERGEERGLLRGRQEGRSEGLQEGRNEGLREGRKRIIRVMLQKNLTPEEISEWTGEDISLVREIEQEV